MLCGLEFRIQGLGFRIWFWAPGFRFWVLGSGWSPDDFGFGAGPSVLGRWDRGLRSRAFKLCARPETSRTQVFCDCHRTTIKRCCPDHRGTNCICFVVLNMGIPAQKAKYCHY